MKGKHYKTERIGRGNLNAFIKVLELEGLLGSGGWGVKGGIELVDDLRGGERKVLERVGVDERRRPLAHERGNGQGAHILQCPVHRRCLAPTKELEQAWAKQLRKRRHQRQHARNTPRVAPEEPGCSHAAA